MKYLAFYASLLSIGVLAAGGAAAGDWYCPPNPPKRVDNVIVTGPCKLMGTRVKGNVEVRYRGDLEATGAKIRGNVQAEGAKRVILSDETYVRGDVQLKYLKGMDMYESEVSETKIGGDLQLEENKSVIDVLDNMIKGNLQVYKNYEMVNILMNMVGGDLQVFDNKALVNIENNKVKGNLQCKDNFPEPNVNGNMVYGDTEDQCATY